MKRIISVLIVSIVFSGCSNLKEKKDPEIELNQNFTSSEIILDWFNRGMPDEDIKKIINEPGIQIMESNVILNNDEPDEHIINFEKDLRLFKDSLEKYKSIYRLNLAYQEKENTQKLLNKIKVSRFDTLVIDRAVQYFPDDFKIKTSADIYYVLTGWKWGDAYVRKIENVKGKYKITNQGKPTLIFNLSLFAKLYGKTTDEQFQTLSDIMSHELFHFAFKNYQKNSPNYQIISDSDYFNKLLEIVQDEGIAHYIDMQNNLRTNFSKYQEYQNENFNNLNKALKLLSSENINAEEKQGLLTSSNVGKYWSKYGAISGMFMAYHIERLIGKDAITNTIKGGPISFISIYKELQKKNKELHTLNYDFSTLNQE